MQYSLGKFVSQQHRPLFFVSSMTEDEDTFVINVTSEMQNTDMMEHVSSQSSCQPFTIRLVLMVVIFHY
jgi:hypothetical protein